MSHDAGDLPYCGIGCGLCLMNASEAARLHQLSRCLYERRQRAVRALRKKSVAIHGQARLARDQLCDEVIDHIRAGHVHPRIETDVAFRSRRNQHWDYISAGTLPMIAAKIACIRGRLVEISLRRHEFSLQFQHHDSGANEKDHIWAA